MNIVINRMKELETEVARLKKQNDSLQRFMQDRALTIKTEEGRKKRIEELEAENSELTAINSKLWRENEIVESMLKVSLCEVSDTREKKEELEKEIERLKRLAEEKCNEVDRLKKENAALTHNHETLEAVTTASLTEKSGENEQLKIALEASRRELSNGCIEYNKLLRKFEETKAELKQADELVRSYINKICEANNKLESVKDYVNKTL